MKSISVITVSFRTPTLTLRCIDSVQDSCHGFEFEHIVIDNASGDESIDRIRHERPDVRLIALTENVGFGPACNVAARVASGDLILLLNPDAELREDTISALMKFVSQFPKAGMWGGVCTDESHQVKTGSAWNDFSIWGFLCLTLGLNRLMPKSSFFSPQAIGGWDRNSVRQVPVISGCLLAIDKSLWKKLNGFDERFFMYSEDFDLCLRARQLGAVPIISPNVIFVHEGGASEKAVPAEKRIRLLLSQVQFIEKHWNPVSVRVGKLLLFSWVLHRTLALKFAEFFGMSSLSNRLMPWEQVLKRRHEWLNGSRVISNS